ncbi:unnamed protein product [Pleuronectes platessa]|uniref:Uncharacterized protein n=1 Tax=Pleuronectes platessa TaxID=8262 RepID=A0A9N7YC03_PLEPL|nr:unnamed protein product [Pleuronectes platessa]
MWTHEEFYASFSGRSSRAAAPDQSHRLNPRSATAAPCAVRGAEMCAPLRDTRLLLLLLSRNVFTASSGNKFSLINGERAVSDGSTTCSRRSLLCQGESASHFLSLIVFSILMCFTWCIAPAFLLCI